MSERHDSPPKQTDGPKGINSQRLIEVTENDLPLHCPMPQHLDWSAHPRVYLPIESSGSALCPYCGTLYRLKGKPSGGSH